MESDQFFFPGRDDNYIRPNPPAILDFELSSRNHSNTSCLLSADHLFHVAPFDFKLGFAELLLVQPPLRGATHVEAYPRVAGF